jgi:hypothetical protein
MGSVIWVLGSESLDLEIVRWDLQALIWEPGSEICNLVFGIWDLGCDF